MTIDKTVEKEIDGKTYKFCYPIKVLFRAERELQAKNILSALADMPLCLEDTYTLFKYALIGGGHSVDDIDDVYCNAVAELGYTGLFEIIVNCLQKSGALGNTKTKNA